MDFSCSCFSALLFSATFRKRIERLARDILADPIRIIQGELGEVRPAVIMTTLIQWLTSFLYRLGMRWIHYQALYTLILQCLTSSSWHIFSICIWTVQCQTEQTWNWEDVEALSEILKACGGENYWPNLTVLNEVKARPAKIIIVGNGHCVT